LAAERGSILRSLNWIRFWQQALVNHAPVAIDLSSKSVNAQTERLTLSGPAGAIEAVRDSAAVLADGAAPRGVAIIAHPHPLFGGTMDNKVVQTLARAFVQCGWTAGALQLPRRGRHGWRV
jgi:hypothetical protein